jgi:toxin-antitoxin system PIN domain toxin
VRIPDANVLLHAVNRSAEQHPAARSWLEVSLGGSEPVGFTWVALLAFLRLSTRRGLFPTPLDAETATTYVEEWLGQPPARIVHPTGRHLAVLRGLLLEAGTAGNLTTDAHLAAVTIEHGAELWSFDRDFARFGGLRWRHPSPR